MGIQGGGFDPRKPPIVVPPIALPKLPVIKKGA